MDDKPNDETVVDKASLLEHVEDESEQRQACREWIDREFHAGGDADAILQILLSNGWDADDAEAMVEQGRRKTRHLRGVVTREQVARVAERRYRQAINIAPRYAVGGMIWVGINFLLSLTSFGRIPWPTARRAVTSRANEPENQNSGQ